MALNNVQLPVTFAPFPPGTCFQSDADLANAIAENLIVTFPGSLTPWNIGSSVPSVDNRDKPWLKINASDNSILGVFSWNTAVGQWTQNHWQYHGWTPPLQERRIFVGTLTDLQTYEGGSPGTVSSFTGPFWVQDTLFTDGFAVGAGGTIVPTPLATNKDYTQGAAFPQAVGVLFIKPSGRIFDVG
jgi:hypothetical protein